MSGVERTPPEPTIRQRAEAIRTLTDHRAPSAERWDEILKHAQAILDALDNAERCGCVGWLIHLANPNYRFVPDPGVSVVEPETRPTP